MYQVTDDTIELFFSTELFQTLPRVSLRYPFFHFYFFFFCPRRGVELYLNVHGSTINMRVILTGDVHVGEFSKLLYKSIVKLFK